MKQKLLIVFSIVFFSICSAQNTEVVLSVNWPQWSTENKVEFYDPNGTLLETIDNGYDGSGSQANPYSTSTIPMDYPVNNSTTAGYYVIVYDTYGDGWNGSGSLTITTDGQSAFTFNGSFNTSATNSEISQTIYLALEQPAPPFPGISQFDSSGNNYIEYIPGNIPIIISAPHGGVKQSGLTIGGTSYPDNDNSLPDRNCGTVERDDNTDILIREIQQSVYDQTGCYPYIIINNLHRSKLDPNRASAEATCGDSDALFYWNEYHNFIDTASADVMNTFGKGLYIDLHGQSHAIPRIEAGYNISASDLNNTTTNFLNTVSNSTISNLVTNNIGGLTQEQLVRGPNSLGGIFSDTGGAFYNAQGYSQCGVSSGYRTLPSDFNGGSTSCDDTRPYSNSYFDGDFYSNKRHGSGPAASDGLGGGGSIDGIMTEVNRRVRDLGTYNGNTYDTRPQTLVPFADDYATVIVSFLDIHYNDFADFEYASNSYSITDSNPMPIITGSAIGTFSSTPGLVINAATGEINTAASTTGNYTVTYQIDACNNYSSTFNLDITDSTLSVMDIENINFKLYPNPTDGLVSFISNIQVTNFKVYNILGQQVIDKNPNSKEATLDLSQIKSGSYFIKIYSFDKLIGSKMIIKN
ncbi:T9SS type A sorting domain-containing protein [Olleya sp. Hel_I_94]|uniref:T9SS type A sorting domain-containing protein n=1 Tax=Olleya sp. Hel_I_94 TaxID=1250001 RepID=UPI0011A7D180|nr:T9SS type A sorting domain-containing protein [Olleya sp. Hel_I_94]TVZ47371.1 putative secreted protein (Por secretion system target) [Olleya sp. Hel_I_94]